MRNSWFIGVIIFLVGAVVNAKQNNSFKDQLQIAILKGEDISFRSDAADHMSIERGLPARVLEVDINGSNDGLIHDFVVILKNKNPSCVILRATKDSNAESHSEVYRVSLKGKLENSFVQMGKFDAEHKPIRGSGVITDRELTPEVKAAFQHELDFWLKGLYRKPAAAGSVAPKSN